MHANPPLALGFFFLYPYRTLRQRSVANVMHRSMTTNIMQNSNTWTITFLFVYASDHNFLNEVNHSFIYILSVSTFRFFFLLHFYSFSEVSEFNHNFLYRYSISQSVSQWIKSQFLSRAYIDSTKSFSPHYQWIESQIFL